MLEKDIKCVIFDMDGTILDTEKWLHIYWIQAAEEYGYTMSDEAAFYIRSLNHVYCEEYLKSVFGQDFDYAAVRNRRAKLMNEHIQKHGLELKEGAEEILDFLRHKGIMTAVATATDSERTGGYLKSVGLFEKFDKIVCANEVKIGKPEPYIYLYACEQLGLKPEECLAAEDSPNGVKSAAGAGIKTIFIPDLTDSTEGIEKFIYKKCSNLLEIKKLFE